MRLVSGRLRCVASRQTAIISAMSVKAPLSYQPIGPGHDLPAQSPLATVVLDNSSINVISL
jgi:hypothetical protein